MHHKFSQKKKAQLSDNVVIWYRANCRDLPWRKTKDPYKIWLSEIMLQQTTVQQGTDYYLRFLAALPTLEALAKAPLDQVLKLWEGLGYYSRARNLHTTAIHIHNDLAGQFPVDYNSLLKLKGVGTYTAAAIASFVYNLPQVVVDGNVLRVISRIYSITEPVDLPATKKVITQLAQELLEFQSPEEFNQAIMEFGALCCTYKKPTCNDCPMSSDCVAHQKNTVSAIPVKSKKIKKRKRYFHCFVVEDSNQSVLVYQRIKKDIWQGLYAFPLIEVADLDAPLSELPQDIKSLSPKKIASSPIYKQTLTHQYIHIVFHNYKVNSVLKKTLQGLHPHPISDISELAFPKIFNNFLSEYYSTR